MDLRLPLYGHSSHRGIANDDRSTRGDASIGTLAVVDTCGYTPPHTPSKAVLGVVRGRWSVAGSAERDGDDGGHGVHQHVS